MAEGHATRFPQFGLFCPKLPKKQRSPQEETIFGARPRAPITDLPRRRAVNDVAVWEEALSWKREQKVLILEI
jgi:hypothetical protein